MNKRHKLINKQVLNTIKHVLNRVFGYSKIKTYDNRLTFRCPICRDSKYDKDKMRGNWYYDGMYVCFNCGIKLKHKDAIAKFMSIIGMDNNNLLRDHADESLNIDMSQTQSRMGSRIKAIKMQPCDLPIAKVLLPVGNDIIGDIISQNICNKGIKGEQHMKISYLLEIFDHLDDIISDLNNNIKKVYKSHKINCKK